jgi:hypothetical protein
MTVHSTTRVLTTQRTVGMLRADVGTCFRADVLQFCPRRKARSCVKYRHETLYPHPTPTTEPMGRLV